MCTHQYLNAKTAGRMIRQLLNTPSVSYDDIKDVCGLTNFLNKKSNHAPIAKKMTEKELCEKLNIGKTELKNLYNFQASHALLAKVSKSLSALYCRTKFVEANIETNKKQEDL